MGALDRYRVVLLDLNGTFMFGGDRFGPGEDFHATYRSLGGSSLSAAQVEAAVRSCYARMAIDYEDPARHDDFPRVAEVLRAVAPGLPEAEIDLLDRAFAAHEVGRVPDAHAAFLRRLAGTHRLGLVTNVWSGKGPWLAELGRAGVLGTVRPAGLLLGHQERQAVAAALRAGVAGHRGGEVRGGFRGGQPAVRRAGGEGGGAGGGVAQPRG
jgi:hypothetical protein